MTESLRRYRLAVGMLLAASVLTGCQPSPKETDAGTGELQATGAASVAKSGVEKQDSMPKERFFVVERSANLVLTSSLLKAEAEQWAQTSIAEAKRRLDCDMATINAHAMCMALASDYDCCNELYSEGQADCKSGGTGPGAQDYANQCSGTRTPGPSPGPGTGTGGGSECSGSEILTDVEVTVDYHGTALDCLCTGTFESQMVDGDCITTMTSGDCDCGDYEIHVAGGITTIETKGLDAF